MIIILHGCTRKEGALVRQFNDTTVLGTLQHNWKETKLNEQSVVVNAMFTVIYISPSLGQLH